MFDPTVINVIHTSQRQQTNWTTKEKQIRRVCAFFVVSIAQLLCVFLIDGNQQCVFLYNEMLCVLWMLCECYILHIAELTKLQVFASLPESCLASYCTNYWLLHLSALAYCPKSAVCYTNNSISAIYWGLFCFHSVFLSPSVDRKQEIPLLFCCLSFL